MTKPIAAIAISLTMLTAAVNIPGLADDKLHSNDKDLTIEFEHFLDRLDQAINQFVNGNDSDFKELWSHAEDITVAGGFGGEMVQGWESIGPRLSRVSASYGNTQYITERITSGSDGELGYLIQHEYFHRPGETEPYRKYRVTMLFRIESGEWKLFHRHADSQVVFQEQDVATNPDPTISEETLEEYLTGLYSELMEAYILHHNTDLYAKHTTEDYQLVVEIGLIEDRELVLIGNKEMKGSIMGYTIDATIRYMTVFVKEDGRWKMLSGSFSPVVHPSVLYGEPEEVNN